MEVSLELVLAAWGAVVATTVAIFEIAKEYRQRPKIKVDASMLFRSCGEDEETHGVKIKDPNWGADETIVTVTIRNFGLQPIQICAVYVETETDITQVIPTGFPVILQPKTSVTTNVQPEWFAPVKLDKKPDETAGLQSEQVVSIGLFDALGKKHPINKENLKPLTESCRELPLRVGIYKHKLTGDLVTAFQTKEQVIMMKK